MQLKSRKYLHMWDYFCTFALSFRPLRIKDGLTRIIMTYDEYIAQQQQAMDEEQQDDSCFLEYQPEGQFVRGH